MHRPEARRYIGRVFVGATGSYTIGELIGFGGYTGVFHAVEQGTGREVAVKALGFEGRAPSTLADFKAEVETLQRLSPCPNVVTLLDEGTYSVELEARAGRTFAVQVPFMVIERAVTDFRRMLKARDEIPWAFRLTIFHDVVDGVSQMHRAGLAHGDIKASNCLVFADKPEGRITDVGVSKPIGEPPWPTEQDCAQAGTGDPLFAPPEQMWSLGVGDPQSARLKDLYLLGSLLYECAMGKGITASVLSSVELPACERDVSDSRPVLRRRYASAYEAFESAMPACVAEESAALLRQLTDPNLQSRGGAVLASDDLGPLRDWVDRLRNALDDG